MKQRWVRKLFGKRLFVASLLIIQFIAMIAVTAFLANRFSPLYYLFCTISFFVGLYIISKKEKPAYKLLWVILLLAFPIFSGFFYIFSRMQTSTIWFRKRQMKIQQITREYLVGEYDYLDDVKQGSYNLPRYLQLFAKFPIYPNTQATYLSPGEEKFHCLLEELSKAEKYIYLEYFLISNGKMWGSILEILKERVAHGVEVRVLYDDFGCFMLLPYKYPTILEDMGIKCRVFNKFMPFLSTVQNNRDHRKIAVIDGKVAFTGGINLADEYINAKEKYGHWKDASIVIKGEGAWSFAVLFLEMWHLAGRDNKLAELAHLSDLKPNFSYLPPSCDGFVQPYFDSPIDTENIGEQVYLQIISSAQKYLYIATPYLIVDENMISAITMAAKSGVDVRILTPHIGDKFLVHLATRSYYKELITAGVKVFEYSNGFIHSKTFISDDLIGTVGSTNMDFRSLYLHFECGVCVYNSSVVVDIKEDYLKTLLDCKEIVVSNCSKNPLVVLSQELLRIFAPLM